MLDNKITEIFWSLIESGTKYIDKIDYINKSIIYKVNNNIIRLSINSGISTPNRFTTSEDIFNVKCLCTIGSWEVVLEKIHIFHLI